jgi:hypothetical protein
MSYTEKQDPSKKLTETRNLKLLKVFTANGLNVRLIGQDNPMVIWDDRCLISCFVNGNELFFRTSPTSSEIVKKLNLNSTEIISKYELLEVLEMCEHQPVYRIKLSGKKVYLVGFMFSDEGESHLPPKFPVFGMHHPLVYINFNKVDEIYKFLLQEGYKVDIVK